MRLLYFSDCFFFSVYKSPSFSAPLSENQIFPILLYYHVLSLYHLNRNERNIIKTCGAAVSFNTRLSPRNNIYNIISYTQLEKEKRQFRCVLQPFQVNEIYKGGISPVFHFFFIVHRFRAIYVIITGKRTCRCSAVHSRFVFFFF